MATQYVSFLPDDFVRGGLISNVDVETVSARFIKWDYDGKADPSTPEVLALQMEVRVEGEQDIIDQKWSLGAGALAQFTVSDDGYSLVPKKDGGQLNDSSNFSELMRSLQKAGFLPDKLREGHADHFLGMKWHLVRVNTDRSDLPPNVAKKEGKADRKPQVAICQKLIWTKFDKKGQKQRAAAAPAAGTSETAAAAPATPVNGAPVFDVSAIPDNIKKVALTALDKLLAGNSSITSATLRKDMFLSTNGEPMDIRQACAPLFANSDWLADQGYAVSDNTLTKVF